MNRILRANKNKRECTKMLDALFNLFKTQKLTKFVSVVGTIENLIVVFEQEFEQDNNAKNAAIDSIIKILESHKT